MTAAATRTELAILGLLAWRGEATGYELQKLATGSVGFIWAPARSQLYAVLKRLDAAGLVAGRRVAQADRPDKRIFRLTAAGEATLRTWLDEVEAIEPEDRDGILLKVFFGAGAAQLLDYRMRVEERLATYREIELTFEGESGVPALRRLQTLRLGMALMEASLAWADETLAALAPAEAGT
jgi:DNA-binding PadR family transcriptional regulator